MNAPQTNDALSARIAARVAALNSRPKTHAVVTRYDDGSERRFETATAQEAENHAIGERRKVGRTFFRRNADLTTGPAVTVLSVEVVGISAN